MEPLYERKEYQDVDWNTVDRTKELDLEDKFQEEKKKALFRMAQRERKNELRKINESARLVSERSEKFTTSKLLMYVILINCFVVEIYSMWAMIKLSDLSALYSLIGAVIGESVTYAIYCAKSFHETKEEERIKLERDKIMNDSINSDIPEEEEDTQ